MGELTVEVKRFREVCNVIRSSGVTLLTIDFLAMGSIKSSEFDTLNNRFCSNGAQEVALRVKIVPAVNQDKKREIRREISLLMQ